MNYVAIPGIKESYRTESAPVITIENIISAVCNFYHMDAEGLKGKYRRRGNVHARYVIFYFIRKYTKMTFKEAGLIFNRDHTTVIHGLETLKDIMQTEPGVRAEVESIQAIICETGKASNIN